MCDQNSGHMSEGKQHPKQNREERQYTDIDPELFPQADEGIPNMLSGRTSTRKPIIQVLRPSVL